MPPFRASTRAHRRRAFAGVIPVVLATSLLAGCSAVAEHEPPGPSPALEAETETADDAHGHVHDAPVRPPEHADDPKLAALAVDDVPAIVFASNDDGTFRLAGIEPDGSGRVVLSELAATNPAWSADGSRLSVVGRVFRDEHYEMAVLLLGSEPGVDEIITGSRVPSVSSFRANDEVYVQTAQVSSRESSGAQSVSAIEAMRVDGTPVLPVVADAASVYQPAWSPSGTRLAYIAAEPGCRSTPETPCEQPLMVWENGRTRALVQGGVAAHPAWSPDGRTIAYSWLDGGVRQVRTVSLDGSVERITDGAADADDPAWSPDGDRIAFTRDCDIWTQSTTAGEAENLTDSAACELSPAWRPHGATSG